MAVVEISMRGFAEVHSAAPSRKHAVLRRYRSPKSGESVGRSNYYVKALSAIKRHHRGDSSHVGSTLRTLLAEAATETNPRKKAKLLNNHRAITDYLKNFGSRTLTIKPGKHFHYTFRDLVVSARPDLVAEENGNLILIKLNLGKDDFAGGVSSTLLHVLYEAAQVKGIPVKPTGVECLHASSGARIRGPRQGFPSKQVLNNACQEILTMCAE